jgi:hypothetical protein
MLCDDRTSLMSFPSTFAGMYSPWATLMYTLNVVDETVILDNSKFPPR